MHNTAGNSGAEPGEMPSNRDHLTRRDVEQLLDASARTRGRSHAAPHFRPHDRRSGRFSGTRQRSRRLRAPPPGHSNNDTHSERRSVPKGAIARLASAKMFVVATVAVLATGGIALAATTGNLPDPLPGSPHITTTASETTPDSSAGNTTPSHAEPKSHDRRSRCHRLDDGRNTDIDVCGPDRSACRVQRLMHVLAGEKSLRRQRRQQPSVSRSHRRRRRGGRRRWVLRSTPIDQSLRLDHVKSAHRRDRSAFGRRNSVTVRKEDSLRRKGHWQIGATRSSGFGSRLPAAKR